MSGRREMMSRIASPASRRLSASDKSPRVTEHRLRLELTLAEGLRLERTDIVAALGTADVTEGLAAFEARRRPAFPSAQEE